MKLKYIIFAFASVLIATILNVISYFAAFAITVMTGGVNVLETESALVNQGIFNVVRYLFIIVIFGCIFYRVIYYADGATDRKESVKDSIKFVIKPLNLILFLLAGLAIQLGTDAVLYILGTAFPTTFASYKHMMETFSGSHSPLFIITTFTLGPIAEELIFRGVTLEFLLKGLENRKRAALLSVLIQAALFGLYHGNIVQAVYAFIFGILLGILAVKTKSLVPSILLHAAINGSLYLIPENVFFNIQNAILVGTLSITIMVSAMVILLQKYKNHVA